MWVFCAPKSSFVIFLHIFCYIYSQVMCTSVIHINSIFFHYILKLEMASYRNCGFLHIELDSNNLSNSFISSNIFIDSLEFLHA